MGHKYFCGYFISKEGLKGPRIPKFPIFGGYLEFFFQFWWGFSLNFSNLELSIWWNVNGFPLCYGLVDKLKRMGPIKAEFQNLILLNFHLIICSVLTK